MNNFTSSFEDALEENLTLYITPQATPEQNIFSTRREIAIARFALSKQAEAYAKAIEIFNDKLDDLLVKSSCDAKLFTDIMMLIQAIENKSNQLIKSVKEVTELLGKAVSIDVDKGALRTMISNMPSLVKNVITNVTNDPMLADSISLKLNNQLTDIMVAFRFDSADIAPEQAQGGVDIHEYTALLNSVPTQPRDLA